MMYSKRPEPFHARLNDLFHSLFDNDGQNFVSFTYLIQVIAKEHPEVITAEHIDYIFEAIKISV